MTDDDKVLSKNKYHTFKNKNKCLKSSCGWHSHLFVAHKMFSKNVQNWTRISSHAVIMQDGGITEGGLFRAVSNKIMFWYVIYEGRTESHEQLFFLYANWEKQTKESAVVDGTSCCVILECLVTSIAWITCLVSLLTKWPITICRFASVLSSNSLWKRKSLLQKIHQRLQRAYGSVCMGLSSVRRWVKHFKGGKTEAIQKAVRQCLRMAGTEF